MSWKFKSILYGSFKKYLVIQQDISCVSTSTISLWFGRPMAFHGCQSYLNWITLWKLRRHFLEFVSNFRCQPSFYYLRWDRHDNLLISFSLKELVAFSKIPPRVCSLGIAFSSLGKNAFASSVTPQMMVRVFCFCFLFQIWLLKLQRGRKTLLCTHPWACFIVIFKNHAHLSPPWTQIMNDRWKTDVLAFCYELWMYYVWHMYYVLCMNDRLRMTDILAFQKIFVVPNYKLLEGRQNIYFLFHIFNISQNVWYIIGAWDILTELRCLKYIHAKHWSGY